MKLPKAIKFRDLKRVFRSFGVIAIEGSSPGHKRKRHCLLADASGNKFPIPAHNDGDDVYRTYVEAARRKFRLTPEDGVSDREFYGRC
jgi:hypothetical protein